jgi:hypothetical protein
VKALRILFLTLLICVVTTASKLAAQSKLEIFDHSHKLWSAVLMKHVTVVGHQSSVTYQNIKAAPSELEAYIRSITIVTKAQFESFTKEQQLAFLINAYNAFTVLLVVDKLPLKSIKDLGDPWSKQDFMLLQRNYSLNQIEHDLIRKPFGDPRIHFALVCAARSCPPLLTKAYTAEILDEQVEQATKNFLTDSERNYFSKDKNAYFLSPIFDWYKDDFGGSKAKVITFVATRLEETADSSVEVHYLDYDWGLNGNDN